MPLARHFRRREGDRLARHHGHPCPAAGRGEHEHHRLDAGRGRFRGGSQAHRWG